MHRRDVMKGAAAGIATLAMPRISLAQTSKILRFKPNSDLTILDPIATSAFVTRYHAYLTFDTLYGQDSQFNPHPQMVDGHVIENDGLVWRLRLRDGLKFHDGEPVLARDCVASINRWAQVDAFGQALLAVTDELSAPSDSEIVFRLSRPFPLLPAALGKSSTFIPVIMPERLASQGISQPITEMIGSGPFRYVAAERVPGQLTIYEKFTEYRPRPDGAADYTSGPKIAHVDRVEWRVIPDQATAAASLQAGEIDWFEDPITDLVPMLEADPNVVVETIGELGNMGIIRFNHLQPPFDRPEMRRAVAKVVSQTEIMQAVAGHAWNDNVGYFVPESPIASSDGLPIAKAEPDFDQIKAELAEAGYNGETITIIDAQPVHGMHMQAVMLADQMTRAGMKVDVVALDFGSWLQRRNNRDAPANGGWNILTTFLPGQEQWDPAGHLALRGNGVDAWSGWPTSDRLEQLRRDWFEAPSEAARKDLGKQMQLQAIEDVPYVPSGRWTVPTAYRKGITGISKHIPIFYNVKMG